MSNDLIADRAAPARPPCALSFNASDPSGAGGLAAGGITVASALHHALPVATSVWLRDSRHVHGYDALDTGLADGQACAVLKDIPVAAIIVGFAVSRAGLGTISAKSSDDDDAPVVTDRPELARWPDGKRKARLAAREQLALPQTDALVGKHHMLGRWLLPDWEDDSPPGPREIARAAAAHGVGCTLATGPTQGAHIDNHLATQEVVLAHGIDLTEVGAERRWATRIGRCATAFQPGVGRAVPGRLFWADDPASNEADDTTPAP